MTSTSSSEARSAPSGRRRTLRVLNVVAAFAVTAVVVIATASGVAGLPALAQVLDPHTGVWTSNGTAATPTDQTLSVAGITTPTTIGFEQDGTAHIKAGSDADMFRAFGYAQARMRLFQMDLMRRQAAGRLSEVIGKQGLDSDEFELDLGLNRAAARDWAAMPADAPARAALVAYTQGVNAAMAQMKSDHTLPMYFAMLGYQPQAWTPVDSLLIQRLVTQMLSLDDRPATFSYIEASLGRAKFDSWFKAAPQNKQYPFDPGPYRTLPLTTVGRSDPAAPDPTAAPGSGSSQDGTGDSNGDALPAPLSDRVSTDVTGELDRRMSALPANALHTIGNSNVWVISGKHTASGKPILAADPHLTMSLPSIWFQVTAQSPSYDMSGVSLPGMPVVLLGKNRTISWGIANSQHPTQLYYVEKTDTAHPDQYYWKGAWRPMAKVDYTIKVKDGASEKHTVRLTVHGPIMTQQGVTAAVWWAGTMPSDDLDAALGVARATNFSQFHQALSSWHAPAENFGYADVNGNIGIVNAGYAPQVPKGVAAYLPMSGTGEADVTGVIPFDALPITYNPKSGFASAANQREVTSAYPYYFGRGYDFYDQGWRQAEIVHALSGANGLTVADSEKLQQSQTDDLARILLPTVLKDLQGSQFSGIEQKAYDLLQGWKDYDLGKDSAPATIWLKFVNYYYYDVLMPLWQQYKIGAPPTDDGFTPRTTEGGYTTDALAGMIVNATVSNPTASFFSTPDTGTRDAAQIVRQAFGETIKELQGKRGDDPTTWHWGDSHFVLFSSLLQDDTLDRGPYHFGGNGRTINTLVGHAPTRDGKELTGVSDGGPSWRFVTDFGTGQSVSSLPGGASENPASPWYANGIQDWLDGRYTPLLDTAAAHSNTEGRTWTLTR